MTSARRRLLLSLHIAMADLDTPQARWAAASQPATLPPNATRLEERTMADHTPQPGDVTDRNLALELVRVTEAAALAASRWIGLGKKNEADGAAVEAMRKAFDTVDISGTVVIGEGEMDEAPMLYIGEKVGAGGPPMDIAVDPLEGTTLTSKGGPSALAVVALAEHGNFLHAPDIYMDKIAVGGGLPDGVVDLDAPVGKNLRELARAKKCEVSDLVACILDRDRHKELIAKTREAGARIMLISDGDVAGVVATATPDSEIDIYLGSGGAPEGRAGRGGAALHRRADAGAADVRERRAGASACATMGHTDPKPEVHAGGDGEGRRDVRLHRRHVGRDAARREALRPRRDHAFDGDAQQVRHGAVRRGAPQLPDQDLGEELRNWNHGCTRMNTDMAPGASCASVFICVHPWLHSHERLRPRRRPQPERAALGLAQRRGPHRSRHRPAHGPAGDRRPPAGRARHRHRRGVPLPRSHAARAAARSVAC